LITDESGITVTDVMYQPFGESVVTGEEDHYLYNGKEKDLSNLYYYGARYYDPAIGRFLTRDPLPGDQELPQTLNKYVYCLNNPLKYIDPTGEGIRDTVEDTFKRLEGVNPDDLAEVQELIDAGQEVEALKKILELLGFEYADNGDGTLTIELGEGKEFTVKIDNSLKVMGQSAYGATDHGNDVISINVALTGNVGDIVLTVLHEVCHGILGGTDSDEVKREHQYIRCWPGFTSL